MSTFLFDETVPGGVRLSTALGTGSANKATSATDIGKAVKLAASNNHVICATTNPIEGFIASVEPFTVNGGFSFGSVKINGWHRAVVGANQGVTAMAVGDYVVADTQEAFGTNTDAQWQLSDGTFEAAPGTEVDPNVYPAARVITGGTTGWRCMRIISGDGSAGSVVLLFKA